jgi:hypothetical protein
MSNNKHVWVDGVRYKVPVRWRLNVWFRAAFVDGIAARIKKEKDHG